MFYVYVLLDRNTNLVVATKAKLPIKLIYYEAGQNKFDAYKREKYLKSGLDRKFLKNRIKQYLIEL